MGKSRAKVTVDFVRHTVPLGNSRYCYSFVDFENTTELFGYRYLFINGAFESDKSKVLQSFLVGLFDGFFQWLS